MSYARLRADALFVIRVGHAWALPKGTTVQVLQNVPSPVTGAESELYVQGPDAGGRPWRGWLAASTPLENISDKVGVASRSVWKSVTHFSLPPIDDLRESIILTVPRDGWDRRENPVKPWTMLDWLCVFGKKYRPKLEAVCQQLHQVRGSIPKDTTELIRRVIKLVLREDVSGSTIAKNRARLTKDAAHRQALKDAEALTHKEKIMSRKTKKVAAKNARQPRANSMPKTVGQALLALKIPALRPIATKMVSGKASNKDYRALKETINLAADKARERGKKSLASQLSSQNRLVRRLERSSR